MYFKTVRRVERLKMSELTEPQEGLAQREHDEDSPSSDEIVELGHVAPQKKKGKPQGKKVRMPKTNLIMCALNEMRNFLE